MSLYIDLLITHNDLTLDPSNQPLLVDDRTSIAQDIGHMIRESGLLVTLVAERDRFRRADCIQNWNCWWRRTCAWYRDPCRSPKRAKGGIC